MQREADRSKRVRLLAYLILGTANHEAAFTQPTDRRSGVAEGSAGQSDTAPFLGFNVLWRCISKSGRGCGVRRQLKV